MPELRWILIGFGIVLLAAIYLWGRRGKVRAPAEDSLARDRSEPQLTSHGPFVEPTLEESDSDAYAEEATYDESPVAGSVRSGARMRAAASDVEITVRPDTGPVQVREVADIPPPEPREPRRARVEPTFSDIEETAQLDAEPEPVVDSAPSASPKRDAPPLGMSQAPQPRRIERRKILALRLSAGTQRFDGARLLSALEAESLHHGKYDVFHRLHDDGATVFSLASLVEPGTFDLAKMAETRFPGVTLFAQLPGPVPGMHALNELVACSKRLQETLGGSLQDDRGVPLTVHRIERLRQEVREFERPAAAASDVHAGPSPAQ